MGNHVNKKLTEAKMKQGLKLASQGQSMKVIFKNLGLSHSGFLNSLKKTNCKEVHKLWYEELYATCLEFWENLFLENINSKSFRTSGWIFSMKMRFRKDYSQSQQYTQAPTPIEININNSIPQMNSEEALKEREKDSLQELLDNTPLNDKIEND